MVDNVLNDLATVMENLESTNKGTRTVRTTDSARVPLEAPVSLVSVPPSAAVSLVSVLALAAV